MVGLVLVSHSHELAQAVKALAEQQTQGRAPIAAVGGTGDPTQPFGTDATAILEAIHTVYDDDGVVVLMDLGSAIMSAEMALEFLEPEQAARVRLVAAPFVEGAMAAAVQASIGMGLEAVVDEAMAALAPKQEALGVPVAAETPAAPVPAPTPATEGGEIVARVTLVNHAGLHFGPAVLFVQKAAEFRSAITVRNLSTGAGPVEARRFNQVLSLGAEQGHEIELSARGDDAAAAIAALVALIESGFGETVAAPPPPIAVAEAAVPTGGRALLHGLAASPGWAVGRARFLDRMDLDIPRYTTTDPAAEWARYEAAVAQARADLDALAARVQADMGEAQARIFQAHALALTDPDLEAQVREAIFAQGHNAEAAVADVIAAMARRYEAMTGPRFQERAADLRDVGARVLRLLMGAAERAVELDEETVIVADDLAPSQTATLDRRKVVAFCTARGGPTAHTAILARSLGLPAVVGIGPSLLAEVKNGEWLAVDGATGMVVIGPDVETQAAFRGRQAEWLAQRRAAELAAQRPAQTRDGRRVEVVANLGTALEAEAALAAGAEGVGLLRTEFLFQNRREPPDEEEQTAAYAQVAAAMAPRPVIIRTLDIGGDKPAPYLDLPAEANPFLGWRAIRISLALPDFFKTQLRAILRAAVHGNVHLMFPMVATVAELEAARQLLAEAAAELAAAGVAHRHPIPTGMMVEVPAAVVLADQLAPRVDFFSIGTNDLSQYTFAADRGNARVAALADALHPAVLRQIARVIEVAHAAGKWVGVCGELAGQPEAIPVLVGLGLDEFSMAPPAIPAAKALIGRLTVSDAAALARRVLDLPDGAAVAAAVRAFLNA